MKSTLFALIVLCAVGIFAQEPGAGAGAAKGKGGARPAPQPPQLVLKEVWKDGPGNVPLTPDAVTNSDLVLAQYPGTNKEDFGITAEGGVPHIRTGLCASSCALTLSSKTNLFDLTGKAHIRWYLKTSGFHRVHPVLKLADGSFVIGDYAAEEVFDYKVFEFFPSQVHWLKLDMPKVQTKGTLLDKVDLSKVEAVGFADLTPGSGHGLGGFSDMGWMEVYGKAVAR